MADDGETKGVEGFFYVQGKAYNFPVEATSRLETITVKEFKDIVFKKYPELGKYFQAYGDVELASVYGDKIEVLDDEEKLSKAIHTHPDGSKHVTLEYKPEEYESQV